jgi:hypothetical protein
MLEQHKHQRFLSANEELRGFMRQAESAANGTSLISWGDFQRLTHCLSLRTCSIGEASRMETLDSDLQGEIAEYVSNFGALQASLEKLRRVMLGRQVQLQLTRTASMA